MEKLNNKKNKVINADTFRVEDADAFPGLSDKKARIAAAGAIVLAAAASAVPGIGGDNKPEGPNFTKPKHIPVQVSNSGEAFIKVERRAVPGDTVTSMSQDIADELKVHYTDILPYMKPEATLDDNLPQDPTDNIVQIGERHVATLPVDNHDE